MGLSVGETGSMNHNWDGLPDLFITHWVAQENALYQSQAGGDILFQDKTRQFGLGEVSLHAVGWGSAFVDLDLDGREEIVVANGSTIESKSDRLQLLAQSPFLFWNEGSRYVNVASRAGPCWSERYSARGLAIADFDDDGDPDIAVSVNGGRPLLLRNDTPHKHQWLKIRLRGPATAIFGARVEIRAGHARQIRWQCGDASYLSMHADELIFGLGNLDSVDQIEVRWADGRVSQLRDVRSGRLTIDHPGLANRPSQDVE